MGLPFWDAGKRVPFAIGLFLSFFNDGDGVFAGCQAVELRRRCDRSAPDRHNYYQNVGHASSWLAAIMAR